MPAHVFQSVLLEPKLIRRLFGGEELLSSGHVALPSRTSRKLWEKTGDEECRTVAKPYDTPTADGSCAIGRIGKWTENQAR